MKKKIVLIRTIAIIGTIISWFPILAPVVLSLILCITDRYLRIDYLMPAELFPVAVFSGALLVLASFLAKSNRRIIGWGLVIEVIMLIGAQMLAVVTGLASGSTAPGNWQSTLVIILLGLYLLALIIVGVGGIRLVYDVYRSNQS
jgi:hypothetical protein